MPHDPRMPTAAKLASAILFAGLGYLVSMLIAQLTAQGDFKPTIQPETVFGYFPYVNAGIGLLCGWLVMGPLTGRGFYAATGSGVRTAATLVFFSMLTFSGREMILRSMKMRYDGPFEAIQGMFGLIADYSPVLIAPAVLVLLIGGGALCGIMAEAIAKRWT